MESLSTKGDGTLQKEKEMSVSTDVTASSKTVITAEIHAKGSIETTSQHSFTIPPGTVLAYSCVQFSVDQNGVIVLHALSDINDDNDAPILKKEDNKSVLVQARVQRDPIGIIKAEFE